MADFISLLLLASRILLISKFHLARKFCLGKTFVFNVMNFANNFPISLSYFMWPTSSYISLKILPSKLDEITKAFFLNFFGKFNTWFRITAIINFGH